MNIFDFENIINKLFPLETQESWDNSGFQLRFFGNVNKILVALEMTEAVAAEAVKEGANLIITHHPIFFSPIKTLDEGSYIGRIVKTLYEHKISLYSSHTPFDIAENGNNAYFGMLLGFENIRDFTHAPDKFLKKGDLDIDTTLEEFAMKVCEKLEIPFSSIKIIGDSSSRVLTVGWCTGAGGDFIENAVREAIDLYITGDVKYHQAVMAREDGQAVLDIGHFGSEKIFTKNMAKILRSEFAKLESEKAPEVIETSRDRDPFGKW